MSKIIISDLEVYYRVGVPDEERAKPQRLLITVEMKHDSDEAAAHDDLTKTIDYFAVSQRLLKFGENKSWKLLETLATQIAEMILTDFKAAGVVVRIKKFIIPQAQFVAVEVKRKSS